MSGGRKIKKRRGGAANTNKKKIRRRHCFRRVKGYDNAEGKGNEKGEEVGWQGGEWRGDDIGESGKSNKRK